MNAPDFDAAQLNDFAAVLPAAAVRDLVVSFRANICALLAELEAASAAQDAKALREHAHDLKGSSGSFGALRLSELAEQIEHRCAEADLAAIADLIAQMQAPAAAALAALQAEADKLD